jgi:P27 family predicted phage terminase small subunit
VVEIGKRGPIASSKSVGHREHPVSLVQAPKQDFPIPEPPQPSPGTELEPRIKRQWEAFWRSDVGSVMREVDVPVLERLFLLRNEWERLNRAVSKHPLIPGSQHRPDHGVTHLVANPLSKRLSAVETAMYRLEAEYGLTPMGRQRLGLAAAQTASTLDALNRQLSMPDDDDDEVDPRLRLIDPA